MQYCYWLFSHSALSTTSTKSQVNSTLLGKQEHVIYILLLMIIETEQFGGSFYRKFPISWLFTRQSTRTWLAEDYRPRQFRSARLLRKLSLSCGISVAKGKYSIHILQRSWSAIMVLRCISHSCTPAWQELHVSLSFTFSFTADGQSVESYSVFFCHLKSFPLREAPSWMS